jgi:hypothetical protein
MEGVVTAVSRKVKVKVAPYMSLQAKRRRRCVSLKLGARCKRVRLQGTIMLECG